MRDGAMSKLTKQQSKELRQSASQTGETVDTSDIPEITNWSGAEQGLFYRPIKQQVTLRIDADLLTWFRSQGNKYQTRINAVLREYVESHRKMG